MEFEDSLFKLRDVTTKKQLLYPACSVRDLQIYWFVTQRAIICSATTMLKLDFDSLLILYSNTPLTFVSRKADEPLGKDLVFERDFDCIMFWRYWITIKRLK